MKKNPNWTAAEIERLSDIANDNPPDRLLQVYSRWASDAGYPMRTRQALMTRLSRSGITPCPAGEWLCSGVIRRILGVGKDTTMRWHERGWLEAHRDGRGRRYYRRSDLRRLARNRPETFQGIAADRLFLLLEDRKLAGAIAAKYPRRAMEPRPVRAVETGWHYPSLRAAAQRMHVTRQAISYAIHHGGTAAGYHWTHA
ncbi:MAG: MerR family transcriptional regulator [Synechococcaceae cyanobacterium]|nr:MerR family transcriptional regulator [Synechococcaceae cyanobacterium]